MTTVERVAGVSAGYRRELAAKIARQRAYPFAKREDRLPWATIV